MSMRWAMATHARAPHIHRLAASSSFARCSSVAHCDEHTMPPLTPKVRSGNVTRSPSQSVADPPDSCTQISPHAWSQLLRLCSYWMKPTERPAAVAKYLIIAPQQTTAGACSGPKGLHCGKL